MLLRKEQDYYLIKIHSKDDFEYLLRKNILNNFYTNESIVEIVERFNYKIFIYIKDNRYFGYEYYNFVKPKISFNYKIYDVKKLKRKDKLNRIL